MTEETAPAGHRAGFIAIAGRPSAGKSTLLNRFLGTKLSIVSPRPQTTRHKILGLLNGRDFQAVFIDTPGWLEETKDRLQDALRRSASSAARDEADLIVWVADGPPTPKDLQLIGGLALKGKPMVLALNKADLPDAAKRLDLAAAAFKDAAPWRRVCRISALAGNGVDSLLMSLTDSLPESPPYYPKDQLSDRYERFFAAELIREQVFAQFREEIPHATAVVIEQYREVPGKPDHVLAALIVEREGQKGILIGEKGAGVRRLREAASREIEKFTGRPVALELYVKVHKDWRKDPKAVKEYGYGELDT